MPRYFFHVRDGTDLPDHLGTELPDIEAARIQAVRASGEAIGELGAEFWDHDGKWEMNVVEETGASVFTLFFSTKRAVA